MLTCFGKEYIAIYISVYIAIIISAKHELTLYVLNQYVVAWFFNTIKVLTMFYNLFCTTVNLSHKIMSRNFGYRHWQLCATVLNPF